MTAELILVVPLTLILIVIGIQTYIRERHRIALVNDFHRNWTKAPKDDEGVQER